MQIKFIRLIDELFQGVPQTQQTLEMKEEIVQNLMEKYNDLRASGKSEEDAFTITAASVGDIRELIGEPEEAEQPSATGFYDEAAVDNTQTEDTAQADVVMQASSSMGWLQTLLISIALIALSPFIFLYLRDWQGIFLMFAMVLGGIGLFIYQVITRKKETRLHDCQPIAYEANQTVDDEDIDAYVDKKKVYRSLNSALWITTVAVYFLISFAFGIWHISWIIYLVASAISSLMRALFGLTSYQKALSSALWVLTTAVFFIISFATGAWYITWIVFLIAAAVSNIIKASRELTKR